MPGLLPTLLQSVEKTDTPVDFGAFDYFDLHAISPKAVVDDSVQAVRRKTVAELEYC
jgi:hypothetical protein